MKQPTFTKREQVKIAKVLARHEALLARFLRFHDTRYCNQLGCGNCGDVGPIYKTLSRLSKSFGIPQ